MKFEKFDLNRALAGEPVILRTRQKAFVRYQETNMSVSKPLMGYTATGDALAWTLGGMNNPAPNFGHYDIVGMWDCSLDDPSYTYIPNPM